jgi:RimJ/RimL family protein N-acetyltransferase
MHAILDKTIDPCSGRDSFAGIITLSATSPTHASTEFGLMVLPRFQRTHVATNAVGRFLLWLLDPPSAEGLGLRRVEWRSHAENGRSHEFAARLGFKFEGVASGSGSWLWERWESLLKRLR